MTWVVVVCAAVAVVVIALALRSHSAPGAAGEEEPRPGADLPRQDPVENRPAGYSVLRKALPNEEAYVVHGLLVANGIDSAIKPAGPGLHQYTRTPPTTFDLLVDETRVDDAEALLREVAEEA